MGLLTQTERRGRSRVQPQSAGLLTAGRRLGGLLSDAAEWAGNNPLDAAALATSPIPIVGDVVGGVADARAFYDDPSWLNAGLGLAGLLPFVPGGMAGTIREIPDYTKTGWVFKDVKKPNLTRAENRRYSKFPTGETKTIPIRAINATQPGVNSDFMEAAERNASVDGGLPIVVRKNGEFFAMDGHHRITAAAKDGSQNVQVRVINFDEISDDAPLLEFDEKKHLSLKRETDELLRALLGE